MNFPSKRIGTMFTKIGALSFIVGFTLTLLGLMGFIEMPIPHAFLFFIVGVVATIAGWRWMRKHDKFGLTISSLGTVLLLLYPYVVDPHGGSPMIIFLFMIPGGLIMTFMGAVRTETMTGMEMEYSLDRKGLTLRRILGFLCVFWPVGFPVIVACLQDVRSLIIVVQVVPILLFGSPFSIFILPCFLAGIYQLRVKTSRRRVNLGLLMLGTLLSAVALFFVFNYGFGGDSRDIALMSMIVNASTLILMSGLTCVERMPKKLVALAIGTAILAVLVIATTTFMIVYPSLYHASLPPITGTVLPLSCILAIVMAILVTMTMVVAGGRRIIPLKQTKT